MKTVTIALIGSGFAAEFHAKAYSSVSGIEVKIKYVVNRNLDKARNLAVKWKIPYVTSSYADVLRDPEVDVVDIVLPPSLHLTYARQAMEAGKHVVCEKPLTGYFGRSGDTEPIGVNVSKEAMYEALLREITSARQWIQNSPKNAAVCPSDTGTRTHCAVIAGFLAGTIFPSKISPHILRGSSSLFSSSPPM